MDNNLKIVERKYLAVGTEFGHLVGYPLREHIDGSVFQWPVSMIVAADVETSGCTTCLDLSPMSLNFLGYNFCKRLRRLDCTTLTNIAVLVNSLW
jgi:hypothetical protein